MNNSTASQLASNIKTIFESIVAVRKDVKVIIAAKDNRNFQADFKEVMEHDIVSINYLLRKETQDLLDSLELMSAILYLVDLESIRGKGYWREVTVTQPLLATVRAFREHFPEFGVKDARYVIEAYQAGLFE